MNEPEYILVESFGEVVAAVKAELGLAVLDYQYGYISELKETLAQMSLTDEYRVKKFPLVWLRQPVNIVRGQAGIYGLVQPCTVFILNNTDKTWKAQQRMDKNFKPILYPIYRSLLNQLNLSSVFAYEPLRTHTLTDRYYWGEGQQAEIDDVVDCLEISSLSLTINDNPNCLPFKNI